MSQRFWILSVLFSLGVGSMAFRPQVPDSLPLPNAPMLKLTTVPNKAAYSLNETVLTRTVFTNLSDKTLCFPKPDQERYDSVQGDLNTKVIPPPGSPETDRFIFINVIDRRVVWPQETLLKEIKERWVMLHPRSEYTTESVQVKEHFNLPGEWRLQKTYRPPDGSFDPKGAYRDRLKAAALSVGCTLPETKVSAGIVPITIAPPSGKK
jgi:hypothetical protein